MFNNRISAGEILSDKLISFKNQKEVFVVGLPRGGVVTAWAIAKKLNLPLFALPVKKVKHPHQVELAIGAVGPDNTIYINKDLLEGYSDGIVQCIVRHELAEIWSYAKKGKSLVEELENSRIDRVLARSIAHRFARMEEIKYAFENGFDTELFEFAKTHYDDFEEFDLFFSYYKDGIWSYEKSKGGKI